MNFPHRSLRAELPQKAPASGRNAQTRFIYPLTYPCQRTLQPFPALCPGRWFAGLVDCLWRGTTPFSRAPTDPPSGSSRHAGPLCSPKRFFDTMELSPTGLRFVHRMLVPLGFHAATSFGRLEPRRHCDPETGRVRLRSIPELRRAKCRQHAPKRFFVGPRRSHARPSPSILAEACTVLPIRPLPLESRPPSKDNLISRLYSPACGSLPNCQRTSSAAMCPSSRTHSHDSWSQCDWTISEDRHCKTLSEEVSHFSPAWPALSMEWNLVNRVYRCLHVESHASRIQVDGNAG